VEFPGLNILRAIACMLVVTGHVRNLFFEDYQNVTDPSWWQQIVYFMSGFGHESVMIFFVLSGLLVGGKVIRTIDQKKWSWTRYIVERCARLLIVLWPALILTLCIDALGRNLFGTAGIYGGNYFGANLLPQNLEAASSIKVFLANAFFLQGIFAPTAGTNSALWSLSNEFWYYIAFPALCLSLSRSIKPRHRLGAFLSLTMSGIAIWSGQMFTGFSIWLMGVASVVLAQNVAFRTQRILLFGIAALLASLALSRFTEASELTDLLIGMSTAILCLGILTSSSQQKLIGSKLFRLVSDFSYTLYLTHMPLIVFIRASQGASPRWQPTFQNLAMGALITVLTIIWAYLIYRMTEIHTPKLRHFMLGGKAANGLQESTISKAA
jgi:peptidoglycan/LPS O-acetylase OafA/YrhL